jgi:hypothetical protein
MPTKTIFSHGDFGFQPVDNQHRGRNRQVAGTAEEVAVSGVDVTRAPHRAPVSVPSSRSPLTSAAGGRNAVIRAAAYRLVMRNTSRGPRCVHRSVHGWGNDSNRLGRSGMRLVGVRHSLSGGENANAATGQNIGHVAVNCVKWANCDRPIAVLIRPDAILANMDDTTIVEVRIATLRKERSGDERS